VKRSSLCGRNAAYSISPLFICVALFLLASCGGGGGGGDGGTPETARPQSAVVSVSKQVIPLSASQVSGAKYDAPSSKVTLPGQTSLKVGDIFAIRDGIFKVVSSSLVGTTTVLQVTDPLASEVFEQLSLDTTLDVSKAKVEIHPDLVSSTTGVASAAVQSITITKNPLGTVPIYDGVKGVGVKLEIQAKDFDIDTGKVSPEATILTLDIGLFPVLTSPPTEKSLGYDVYVKVDAALDVSSLKIVGATKRLAVVEIPNASGLGTFRFVVGIMPEAEISLGVLPKVTFSWVALLSTATGKSRVISSNPSSESDPKSLASSIGLKVGNTVSASLGFELPIDAEYWALPAVTFIQERSGLPEAFLSKFRLGYITITPTTTALKGSIGFCLAPQTNIFGKVESNLAVKVVAGSGLFGSPFEIYNTANDEATKKLLTKTWFSLNRNDECESSPAPNTLTSFKCTTTDTILRFPPDFAARTYDAYSVDASGVLTIPPIVSAEVPGITFYSYPISATIRGLVTDKNGETISTPSVQIYPPVVVSQNAPPPPLEMPWALTVRPSSFCGINGCVAERPSSFAGIQIEFVGGGIPTQLISGGACQRVGSAL
jgi:hypothetical protein